MNIYNEIKALVAKEGFTLTKVVERINKTYDEKNSLQSYSNKLRRGSIMFEDVAKILDVMDYDINFQKRKVPEK